MKLRALAFLFGAAALTSTVAAQTNVALGSPVELVAGTSNGVALSSLTDGVFAARYQQWQTGTVWWTGLTTTFEINLGEVFLLDSAIVQGDDNDTYRLLYRSLDTGEFLPLWDVPVYGGGGMQTRPNASDSTQRYIFPGGAISTDMLRIAAISGDNSYSLAEVQLFAVPSPGAIVLLALGGFVSLSRRRM